MAPGRTQDSRSKESSARLLDAAEILVAEGGYRAATVAEIGRRAGYSRGLVTERFGSKDDLMWALVVRTTERWYGSLTNPDTEASGLENIRALFFSLASNIEANSTSFQALQRLIMDAHYSSGLERLFLRSRDQMGRSIESLLEQGIEDGSIRSDIFVPLEAQTILATLRGIGYEAFLYPEYVDSRKLYGHYLEILEAHLAPSGS